MLQPDHSRPSHPRRSPENRGLWCCTNIAETQTAVKYRYYPRRRGLNVFEVYFCHLRETRLLWESLPNSSVLPTKLATRLTHLNLR
ncbi:MAG: hypothetical protein WAN66_13705 [Limnoraphis robusta]